MEKIKYDNSTPVVVVGGCHHNTLGVIRSLGWKGLKPILITVSNQLNPYITYSKYIGKYYCRKNLIVPSCEEAYNTLMEIGEGFSNKKAVLILCTDGMSSIVDEKNESLKKYYYIPGIGGG